MRDWLAHRAGATPAAPAVVGVDGGSTTTYAALDERVEELAGRLAARGVGVDDHLGVLLPTRPAFVDLAHAAMRLGAVLVPLNARLTAGELADRIERTDVELLVCGAATEQRAREAVAAGAAGTAADGGHDANTDADADADVVTVDESGDGVERLDRVAPDVFDLPEWRTGSPQLLLSTSGTTGEPKVVVLTMGNLLASAVGSAFRLGLRPDARWYVPLPASHMGGLAPIYRSVLYGTTVLVERGGEGFDPTRTLAAMAEYGATGVSLVPTMLDRLLDADAERDDGVIADLRFALLGGAPATEELVERATAAGVAVCPTYGLTETASQVATALPDQAARDPGTVGNPLLFTDVTVVDGAGSAVSPGQQGELVVSGPTVTPGYYGDSGATAAAFSTHGLHTGDVGYRDEDGRLWVLNRLDDRIVTGGENVDPGEVAGVIRDHPEVTDVAVVGLPDDEWGERVAALVVGDGDLSTAALEAHCRDRLAGYKRPRTVAFADELPRTASDTVDREAVRQRLQAARAHEDTDDDRRF